MLRTIWVWTWASIFTILLGICAFFTMPFDRGGRVVHLYARLWGWLILKVAGIRMEVIGRERIDPKRPVVYMSNHLSSFDIFALLACLPGQFRWLAKAELFRIPILGWGMRWAGYISLERTRPRSAYESMEVAAQKVRDGVSVVIFPEGTRSPDGRLHPFMHGGFNLAIRAQVPIVPISIHGSWEIMPRTTKRVKKGRIRVVIGEPIATKGLTMMDRRRLVEETEKRIREGLPQPEVRGADAS